MKSIVMDKDTYEKLKSHDDEYSNLWKAYFKSTTIQEKKKPSNCSAE